MPPVIKSTVPLAPYTTLGVGGSAEYFAEVTHTEELSAVVQWARENGHAVTILGGGSNVVVPDTGVRGLVVRPLFLDVTYHTRGDGMQHVTAGAGVVLDALVADVVARGLWGLENLSAIPGTVGGVPVQNVGAYGVEARDVVVSVEAYDPHNGTCVTLTREECRFAYRDSYFKHAGAHLVIIAVTFSLSEVPTPRLSYKDLATRFSGVDTPTLSAIRDAVVSIRAGKFPDWRTVGTAGSFFKNPVITPAHYAALRVRHPDMPGFVTDDGRMKVSLGWILDHVCGLRGYTEGNVGLYHAQALVLVCTPEARAEEVLAFADTIIARVHAATDIIVEREVTLLT
jgi:UDP-N-acetylmuramate dehydrogenase